ncbi:MAG: 50S ribosomal protein L11 methyltransferase [Chloroflexota bacterium]|nr:50S ribosomal protein L11 methyltransferase [Chloroflexota bacterium]
MAVRTRACSRASAERSPISRSPKLLRVALSVDAAQVELAVAAWELAGIHNSSVEYLIDEPTEEPWPGHDNRTDRAEVAAYLTDDQWGEIETRLRESAVNLLGAAPAFQVKPLPNRDWRSAWHDHFDIVRIPGPKPIVVRPPHIPYEANANEVVIDLVPGLAFGTGQHQSTRLCLALLAERIQGGERVLDVGTGSGILAVAAAMLGAASVVATDIDPLAVDAARQTVRQNRLSGQIEVREASIPPEEQFDLVVANLTADLLQYLAQDLVSALKPNGKLIASGLVEHRQEAVVSALTDSGLELWSVRSEDEWRALFLCSPSDWEE